MQATNITFTPALVKKLHAATVQAGKDRVKTFMFEGHEMVVDYAEYLLEYLSNRFNMSPRYIAREMKAARQQ